jgi:hypothetical protein
MQPIAPTPLPAASPRYRLRWRGVALGLAGVAIICGLTPFNDLALNNTPLVGNNLPLGVVLLLFFMTLLLNGPLLRWAPRYAFSPADIVLAVAMTSVSCALPSSGLMRYFFPSLVGPLWHAQANRADLDLLMSLNLPSWLFPAFDGATPAEWMQDEAVGGFYGRAIGTVPYDIWLRPLMTWGVFFIGLFGAILCMSALVRRQWNENERLAFPLAQIQLALIESPAPGRLLNDVLRSRAFWIAFALMLAFHLLNGAAQYWPGYFPAIPLKFDFRNLMTEPPLVYAHPEFKSASLYFIILGVTYFVSTPVAFSLWFFFFLLQLYRIILGIGTGDPVTHGLGDQHFGAICAFAIMLLWIGRHHWALVIRQALRGERQAEARGRYLSYPVAAWGLLACCGLMIGWLVFAGSEILPAIVSVILLMTLFLVIARVVAETGLVYAGLTGPIQKPFQLAVMTGWSRPVSMESFYLSSLLQAHHYDLREPLPVYSTHALKMTDRAVFDDARGSADIREQRRVGRRIILALVLALAVGYVIGSASSLWTYYSYSATQDMLGQVPLDEWGMDREPRWMILDPALQYQRQTYPIQHNPVGHVIGGFGLTTLLAYLRLTFAWWPLHPVGYLMLATPPGPRIWFSVMVGWIAKVGILKYGGASLFNRAKPFFLGLIIGEAAAAGIWMLAAIILSSLNQPYHPILLLPG